MIWYLQILMKYLNFCLFRAFEHENAIQSQWSQVANECLSEERSDAVVVSVSKSLSQESSRQQRKEETSSNQSAEFAFQDGNDKKHIRNDSQSKHLENNSSIETKSQSTVTKNSHNENKQVSKLKSEGNIQNIEDNNSIVTISKQTEYPDPNTKITTEVRSLPDGTIIRSQKLESHDEARAPNNNGSGDSHIRQSYTEHQEIAQKDGESQEIRHFEEHSEYHSTNNSTAARTDQSHDIFARSLRSASPPSGGQLNKGSRSNSNKHINKSERSSPTRDITSKSTSSRSETITRSERTILRSTPGHSPERKDSNTANKRRASPSKMVDSPSRVSPAHSPDRRRVPTKNSSLNRRTHSPSPTGRNPTPSKITKHIQTDHSDGSILSTSFSSTKTYDVTTELEDTQSVPSQHKAFYLKNENDSRTERPPLNRSETYEERCRQILGMTDDSTKQMSIDSVIVDTSKENRIRRSHLIEEVSESTKLTTDLDAEDDFENMDEIEGNIDDSEDDEPGQSVRNASRRASTITIEVTKPTKDKSPSRQQENDRPKEQVELLDSNIKYQTKRFIEGTPNPLEKESVKDLLRNDVEIFIESEQNVKNNQQNVQIQENRTTKQFENKKTISSPKRYSSPSPSKKIEQTTSAILPSRISQKTNKITDKNIPTKNSVRTPSPSKSFPVRNASPQKDNSRIEIQSNTQRTSSTTKKIEEKPIRHISPHAKHVTSASITLSPISKRRIVKALPTNNSPTKPSKDPEVIVDKRKSPITERKDSAPVYSSKPTITDVSHKMTRSSTSDGVLRNVSKLSTTSTKDELKTTSTPSVKAADPRRPAKFIATKTVNLSASNQTLCSENLENVFIDIQQAKSSREPSPDRIVPTPVSPDEDTGCPRFPDTVVEPDENQHFAARSHHFEQLSRRDRCVITEVDVDRCYEPQTREQEESLKTTTDQTDQSLRHDVCLLSVQDKVRKVISATEEHAKSNRPSKPLCETLDSNVSGKISQFISIAENIRKSTVPESMFQPKHQKPHHLPKEQNVQPLPTAPELSDIESHQPSSDDQCLLSVSDKINRFTAAAALEQISVLPPQKSPTLVARIERKISRIQENTDDESPYRREETDNNYQRSTSSTSTDRYRTDKQYALRQLSREKSLDTYSEGRRRSSYEESLEPTGSLNNSRRGSYEQTPSNNVRRLSKESSPSVEIEETTNKKTTTSRRGSDEIRRVKSIFENRENANNAWEQRRTDIKSRDLKLTGKYLFVADSKGFICILNYVY